MCAHYIPNDVWRDATEERRVVFCAERGGSFLDLGLRGIRHVEDGVLLLGNRYDGCGVHVDAVVKLLTKLHHPRLESIRCFVHDAKLAEARLMPEVLYSYIQSRCLLSSIVLVTQS